MIFTSVLSEHIVIRVCDDEYRKTSISLQYCEEPMYSFFFVLLFKTFVS